MDEDRRDTSVELVRLVELVELHIERLVDEDIIKLLMIKVEDTKVEGLPVTACSVRTAPKMLWSIGKCIVQRTKECELGHKSNEPMTERRKIEGKRISMRIT